jgi:Histidine kinase-, DNA gyrase B-, and HSP90-like ATPase
MATEDELSDEINAAPTKAFFVEMLVRDIPLEQAVLDLVDNSIDGAKRMNGSDFRGRKIDITLDGKEFRILDNCGGFERALAKDYAFRFGRPPGTPTTPNSIGQFGVGMKRALFKFGRHFVVRSATSKETWAVDVDVDEWEANPDDWHFKWATFENGDEISKQKPGTDIVVDRLRTEVGARFNTIQFVNDISGLIKSKHRQFIAGGLSISVNDTHLDATNLYLLVGNALQPGVETMTFGKVRRDTVKVRIVVGVGVSSPRDAGWYVICNGRVILEHDRRAVTGWGLVENEQGRTIIPSYHNQFARFRGIVSFDCPDAGRLPWNTTKTDVDQDSLIWQKTFERMIDMMRPVINFLNELDKDVDEFTSDESPMLNQVNKATQTRAETLTRKAEFRAPRRGTMKKVQRVVGIQYSKPVKDVDFLQEALGVRSARAVGEKTFDLVLKSQRAK